MESVHYDRREKGMELKLDLSRLGQITEEKLDEEKERKRIVQFLYQLTEQLRYWQYNLDEENLSKELQENLVGKLRTQDGVNRDFSNLNEAQSWIDSLGRYLNGDVTLTLTGSSMNRDGGLMIRGFTGRGTFRVVFPSGAKLKCDITVMDCHSVEIAGPGKTVQVITANATLTAVRVDHLKVHDLYIKGTGYSDGGTGYLIRDCMAELADCNAAGLGVGYHVIGGICGMITCRGGAASGDDQLSPNSIYIERSGKVRVSGTVPHGTVGAATGGEYSVWGNPTDTPAVTT